MRNRTAGFVSTVFATLILTLMFSFSALSDALVAPKKLSESIYLVEDTCNVYVVKRGDTALCVDFGSGVVMQHLKEMNVKAIEWILHTHTHRDQCQGDVTVAQKLKIAIPAKEEQFFAKADEFWRGVDIYDNYSFKPDFFTPRSSIPVAKTLNNGEIFSWRGIDFEVVETPGHTEGSVSYVANIDGQRVAFTGDLIHSPGKVWSFSALSYRYNDNGTPGAENTIKSLRALLDKNVTALYPSRGITIDKPKEAVDKLEPKLFAVVDHLSLRPRGEAPPPRPARMPQQNLEKFLPHLYHKDTSYFIVADSGNVLVYDYIGQDEDLGDGDPIAELKQMSNAKNINLVLHSHYHDDHISGTHYLVEKYGTKVWIFDKMLDVLENPMRYSVPCLIDTPIKADRVLHEWETFQWENYTFTVFHFPGQTEWHMGMFAEIDGRRILFAGDSCLGKHWPLLRGENFNCRNYCRLEDNEGYMRCAKIVQWLKPDTIATAHIGVFDVGEKDWNNFSDWAAKIKPMMTEVVAQPDANFATDPNWVSIYPYRVETRPGERLMVEVKVRNHGVKPAPVSAELRGPAGWTFEPARSLVIAPAKETSSLVFAVNVPQNADPQGRTVLTADITFDGTHLGELAEMLVDHGFRMKPSLRPWQRRRAQEQQAEKTQQPASPQQNK